MSAMDALLARLSESVSSARTAEELTRPLLELLNKAMYDVKRARRAAASKAPALSGRA